MSERATIFQGVQIGVEATATPGTAVAARKKLSALGISPGIKAQIKTFKPMGGKFKTISVLGKEWSESKLDGVMTYSEIVYPLAGALQKVSPTGSLAKTWVFRKKNFQPDTYATFTVEQGSYNRAHRTTGNFIPNLELTFSREECKIGGLMMGGALIDDIAMGGNALYTLTANASPPTTGNFTLTMGGQTTANIAHNATPATVQAALEALSTIGAGNVKVYLKTLGPTLAVANSVYQVEFINELGAQAITLTGTFSGLTASGSIALASFLAGVTLTEIALVPVEPTQISIYLADSHAGLDAATALARPLSTTVSIADQYAPLWALNASQASFAATVEKEAKATLKLKMEADAEGMALLTSMRSGAKKFIRIEGIGDVISDPDAYGMTLDNALVVSNVSEFSDEDGVYAIEWEFEFAYDATWGQALEWTIVNEVAAL